MAYKVKSGQDSTNIPYLQHKFKRGVTWTSLQDATKKELENMFKSGNILIEQEKPKGDKDGKGDKGEKAKDA